MSVINICRSICGKYVVSHEDQLAVYTHVIEEKYSAKYVGEFCYKNGKQGWMNKPMALFYTDKTHPEGSNYMGVMTVINESGEAGILIVDGISAAENEWYGVLNEETGEVIYSAFRHDYQALDVLMADGGPEYLRSSGHPHVKITIVKDKLNVAYM